MISSINLTESGVAAFNSFFDRYARQGVSRQAVMFEVLDILTDRAACAETLVYELGARYTTSGRPEMLTLTGADIQVDEQDDDA